MAGALYSPAARQRSRLVAHLASVQRKRGIVPCPQAVDAADKVVVVRELLPGPPIATDAAQIGRFIDLVRPSGPLLLVAIDPNSGVVSGHSFTIPGERDAAMPCAVERNAAGMTAYWTSNLSRSGLHKKAAKADITAACFVWADIDPDLKTHGSYAGARAHLLDTELPRLRAAHPTVILDSGNGLQAFWKMAEPMAIADVTDIDAFETVNKAFGIQFRGAGTHNIDRVMRVPGTINYPSRAKLSKGYPASPSMARMIVTEGPSHEWANLVAVTKPAPPEPPGQTSSAPDPLQARFEQALRIDAKLAARWGGSTDGLQDRSGSAMDFSVASMLRVYGFSSIEIRRLLEPWPHGSDVGRRDGAVADRYWDRVWDRAGTAEDGAQTRPSTPVTGVTPDAGKVPVAQHLTTDLANANRIQRAYGSDIVVAAGRWYVWSGTHWAADEPAAYRRTCELSKMINAEAREWETRSSAAASGEEADKYQAIATVLRKWASKSEMRNTIDAAFGQLRKLLSIDPALLDADPWLLNVANGTIDLRTGELRDHRQEDYITQLIDIEYDPGARAAAFERMLVEITNEDQVAQRPLAAFLQRWFGYCATGSTREQSFVVHWGAGANGKTTLLEAIAGVLGPYATTAPPRLLMATKGERHPTEIASLFGRRMVTAHESGEADSLNEDLIKQATGSDRLTARFMRQDFFSFLPTHKLQLLTNHKPLVRGQDTGMWRRILLVPYAVRFGTAGEVARGERERLKDVDLPQKLLVERPGILSWIVAGARQWHERGLNAPDIVRAAGAEYRSEQDRVGQFAAEHLVRNPEGVEPLTGAYSVYDRYRRWCESSGYVKLGRERFKEALRTTMNDIGFDVGDVKGLAPRRNVARVKGVKLVPESAFGI